MLDYIRIKDKARAKLKIFNKKSGHQNRKIKMKGKITLQFNYFI